ncbi:MAG TPA: carbohydrate ABC transporter permease [Actinomycetota bacterium]|jgi:multiple sugar transport system permease protein
MRPETDAPQQPARARASRFPGITIAVVSVIFAAPLVAMFLGSLRVPVLAGTPGSGWLDGADIWFNYRGAIDTVPLLAQLRNSLLVVAVAVPVTVLTASWAGFAIVTSSGRRRRALLVASLVALMIPASALWVPRFVMFKWLGLNDTLIPLMAPALMATTPFYVLVFTLAYARIPRTLYEAAAVDGLSPLQTWARVAFPLAKPAVFAVAVLAFVWHWSDFVSPLIYLSSGEHFTLPIGVRALQVAEPSRFPYLLAGSVIATAPCVLAFFTGQRAFFRRTLGVG